MRRIAAALLVLFVAVAGVAVCSRGVQACAAMMASQPDCCGNGISLAKGDCCCPAKGERSAAFLPAGELVKAGGFNPLLATAALERMPLPGPAAPSLRVVPLARVQPPPETLISLHTSLLL